VNGQLDRKWAGPGAVVEGVPRVQASKLVAHKDEFIDVTALKDEDLIRRAARAKADVEDRKRVNRSKTMSGGVLLEYASDEELMAEVERRQLRADTIAAAPPDRPAPAGGSLNPRPRRDSKEIGDKISRALEAIVARQNPNDLDRAGVPKKEAVEELVGQPITDDEFLAVIGDVAEFT
jgi:hypothetical protein